MRKLSTKYLKILVFLSFLALLILILDNFDYQNYVVNGELKLLIKEYGPIAPLAYVLIYAIAIVLFFPAAPFSIIGGAIFGPVVGTVLITVASTTGAFIAFLFARFIFRKTVEERFLKRFPDILKYSDRLENRGLITTAVLRLMIIFPFNVMNFILGITKVKPKAFFFGTLIGIIPAAFVFAFAGHSLINQSPSKIIISISMLTAIFLFAVIYKRRFHGK